MSTTFPTTFYSMKLKKYKKYKNSRIKYFYLIHPEFKNINFNCGSLRLSYRNIILKIYSLYLKSDQANYEIFIGSQISNFVYNHKEKTLKIKINTISVYDLYQNYNYKIENIDAVIVFTKSGVMAFNYLMKKKQIKEPGIDKCCCM